MKNYQKIFTALSLCVCLLATAFAQSGGTYVITQSVISNGGGTSSGGTFGLTGTTGQSVAGGALTGSPYSVTSGFWSSPAAVDAGQGLESDVAGRPSGDGVLQSNDVNQVKRFLIGLDQPDQSNEFQRADSAPFSSRGDADLQANDVNQAKRYLIGLDPEATAAGPTSAQPFTADGSAAKTSVDDVQINSTNTAIAAPRELRVESTSATAGQAVTINIRVDAFGDESGYSFRLNYDQTKLTVTNTAIGTAGGTRLCNTGVAGRITCSVDTFPNDQPGSSTNQIGEIAPGNNQLLLTASFTVAANAPAGPSALTLTNISATNDASTSLTITAVDGTLTITSPTAASVGVSGQVLTADGRGITNVVITLSGADGTQRIARSSAFGYYRFDDVMSGENYVLSVSSKRYTFNPSTTLISVTEELTSVDFIADPRE